MTRPRRTLVDPASTPYYHCIGRCVRRAFLCGLDRYTGQDYSHRKAWMIERLGHLAEVFVIDVCAYAVMSNHYHLVLRLRPDLVQELSDEDVMHRWSALYELPLLVARHQRGELVSEAEQVAARARIEELRDRLADLSWFMRALNEWIARRANAEDGCTGRFWEGRFKSQPLLDEAAVVTCMAYVDLNPVRAATAKTPETSDDTSIQARIQRQRERQPLPVRLAPFQRRDSRHSASDLPIGFPDYLELVDWTGRAIVSGKRGFIDSETPNILGRLGIDSEEFLRHMQQKRMGFRAAVGCATSLREAAASFGKHHFQGIGTALRLFGARSEPATGT